MSQQNASKFAIFLEYENLCGFFRFSFRATIFFFPTECAGLCRHRPGHSLGEKIKKHDMKKKRMSFHISKIVANLEAFCCGKTLAKPLISEE